MEQKLLNAHNLILRIESKKDLHHRPCLQPIYGHDSPRILEKLSAYYEWKDCQLEPKYDRHKPNLKEPL